MYCSYTGAYVCTIAGTLNHSAIHEACNNVLLCIYSHAIVLIVRIVPGNCIVCVLMPLHVFLPPQLYSHAVFGDLCVHSNLGHWSYRFIR